MDRSFEANLAFNRALRRRPADEQATIRTEEGKRLDRLADSVRANAALTPEEADKRLRTVDQLRARLNAD